MTRGEKTRSNVCATWLGLVSSMALAAGCVSRTQWAGATEVSDPAVRTIQVAMGREGFVPDQIRVRSAETVTLVFTRTFEDSCLERVVLHLDDTRKITREAPMHHPVTITLRLEKPGELGLTCSGGGHGATILVEP